MIYTGHIGHRSPRSQSQSPSRNLQDCGCFGHHKHLEHCGHRCDCGHGYRVHALVRNTAQNTDMPPNSSIWMFGPFQNFGKFEKMANYGSKNIFLSLAGEK